jgi:hypothetical protein
MAWNCGVLTMNKLSDCLKIAACICGKDGVISELEEKTMFQFAKDKFPDFSPDSMELALTEFFDSNQQIEDYLALIDDMELRQFTLELAKISASSDGLNIKENIALEKACLIWGMKNYA